MTPEAQLATFLAKYTPDIRAFARAARRRMQARLPGAIEMVYDNYNALVIGYAPTERASDAIFSLALFPRWVTLCFLKGKGLPDPERLLKGGGARVRHIRLENAATLDKPAVRDLMKSALERSEKTIDAAGPRQLIIKSISVKQRPRRPE